MTSSSSQIHYTKSNSIVEELTPKVFLPTTESIVKPDKLLINQNIDEDNSQNTRIYTTEVDFDNMKQKTILRSISTTSKNSKLRQHEKVRCNFIQLLKLCCSWFCGLDDNNNDDDYSELNPTTAIVENNNLIEKHESILKNTKHRPIIEWFLNGNLVFILLVEITIFIVFSIPAKYTFLRE